MRHYHELPTNPTFVKELVIRRGSCLKPIKSQSIEVEIDGSTALNMFEPFMSIFRWKNICLPDQHRVVLGPASQDADGALELIVATSENRKQNCFIMFDVRQDCCSCFGLSAKSGSSEVREHDGNNQKPLEIPVERRWARRAAVTYHPEKEHSELSNE